MDTIDERFAVYTAILFVCSAISALAGIFAGLATLCVLLMGVELAYWLGTVTDGPGLEGASR